MQKYDYTVTYRPGVDNVVADALSCMPIDDHCDVLDEDVFVSVISSDLPISWSDLQSATQSDSVLCLLQNRIINGWPSRCSELETELVPYWNVRHELYLVDNCIARGDDRLLVPAALTNHVIQLGHEGHVGMTKLKQLMYTKYWWPSMDRQIEHFVCQCEACQYSDKTVKVEKVPVQKVQQPTGPWKHIGIDVAGPYATAPERARFLIVVADYYSHFPEVIAVANVTSSVIIQNLLSLFARNGLCEEITTDNGPQFISAEFTDFLHVRGIRHNRTAVYNPAANGLVECFNRVLKEGLQAVHYENTNWQYGLLSILMSYRSTPHISTGKSPSEMLNGRRMRTRLDIIKPLPTKPTDTANVKTSKLVVGDWVKTKLPSSAKGRASYSEPKQIIARKGHWSFKLSDGQVWNCHKLSRCYSPDDLPWPNPDDATPVIHVPVTMQHPEQFITQNVSTPRLPPRTTRGVPPQRYSPS